VFNYKTDAKHHPSQWKLCLRWRFCLWPGSQLQSSISILTDG